MTYYKATPHRAVARGDRGGAVNPVCQRCGRQLAEDPTAELRPAHYWLCLDCSLSEGARVHVAIDRDSPRRDEL